MNSTKPNRWTTEQVTLLCERIRMIYESVDKLQNALGEIVFHYTQDKKKAAGRALGTMVEIITYYLLKTWKFNNSTSIERRLVEYGNEDISHNVEYSLHPIIKEYEVSLDNDGNSITATKILKALEEKANISQFEKKKQQSSRQTQYST